MPCCGPVNWSCSTAARRLPRHERATRRGQQTLVLDHYLEVLARKPGALPGSTALAQARDAGSFTPAHDAFWGAARKMLGDGGGTRALIEVLLLHRHLPAVAVQAGLAAALTVGSCNPDVVAVEARNKRRVRCRSTGDRPARREPAGDLPDRAAADHQPGTPG